MMVTMATGISYSYEKLHGAIEIVTPDMEFVIRFPSVIQCAARASLHQSVYFGTKIYLDGFKCFLSSPGASATSLQNTTNPDDIVWAKAGGTSTSSTTAAPGPAAGGLCTACNPADSSTWGIIPGQVGCSSFNMCSANGVTTQMCAATLVMSDTGNCNFPSAVNQACQC
ncbi:uncharacterized protein LOC135220174 [Macrobrachium nipponense]|uniref:uncharacterized protein LOC135220174 n=1 Tax=Macrobrachium nipponense TaxID=159736 RepID=UPI0030C7F0EE